MNQSTTLTYYEGWNHGVVHWKDVERITSQSDIRFMSVRAIEGYRSINSWDFLGQTKWRFKCSNINGGTMDWVKNEAVLSEHKHISMAVHIRARIRAITRNCRCSCNNCRIYATNQMMVRHHSWTNPPLNFRWESFIGKISLQDFLKRKSDNILRHSCSRSCNRGSGRGWYQSIRNDGTQLIKNWRGLQYSGTFL